ncbi:MAG: DNA-3-methyladenine glycosylase [Ignavibacteriales bacterium]|nr:DNA-3-methyladenine glycosylase [Ignavibacteriales bacterium]
MNKLPRSFYLRPTLQVARDLLGKHIVRILNGKKLVGNIVEVEAYVGSKDPASHTYRGKTKRNEVMFKQGGHLYVYFTYGMHFCANVVTREEDIGEAVLIRAVEPIEGIDLMKKNRAKDSFDLTNGPAKLCEALGIQREQNGTDLLGNEIYLLESKAIPKSSIGTSTRIGIRVGTEKRWRFFVKGNDWVSK